VDRVKATNAYAAKRALIDRLTALAQVVGGPLYGVQVEYAKPGAITDRCIYGDWAKFTQDQGSAEPGLRMETATVDLWVRVLGRAMDARATETLVEGLADVVADELAKDPELPGGLTFEQITSGSVGYSPVDDGYEAMMALQVRVESWLA
jgi:phenylpyruvate tautomerase PptA (4-oxalocrotonate tautomerase family)